MGAIDGVQLTPLKIIEGSAGNVMHALKMQEGSYSGFGEAYFSTVHYGAVKGWKKHQRMILNVVVPTGSILFVLYDDRSESPTYGKFQEIVLSPDSYERLTLPPGIWMAFKGLSEGLNMLLNIASIPHDPAEAENLPLENERVPYKWLDK
jgi:dTDP-4-dehydrorhamnose 3,5-epimerase